jgi:chaperonin GroEL
MKDLCISTGATFISRESGINLSEVKLQHLGSCKTIEVLSNFTTVVDGAGNPQEIDERIEQLKEEIKNTDGLHQAERIQERVTRLASGVAIIRVGGATEVEMVERRHRIEDALAAVKAAQEEGMLPGGGVALARASQDLDVEMDNEDQRLGMQIILESVKAPIKQMAQNAGVSPDIVLEKVLTQEGNLGFDFTRNEIVDMFESGVIDPAKVTRSALENAVSVASTLVTTNHAIVEN